MVPSPFTEHSQAYDGWFDRHPLVYQAELRAVRSLLPGGRGLEVGVGSGRFAGPLGVGLGLDPSWSMLELARGRGVGCINGRAEALPLRTGALDYLLLVTVLCFLPEPLLALREARRVVRPGGRAVIALIDGMSPLGKQYEAGKGSSLFYQEARFYSVDEVLALLRRAGFSAFTFRQTLVGPINELDPNEPVTAGWGQGGLVVVAAG